MLCVSQDFAAEKGKTTIIDRLRSTFTPKGNKRGFEPRDQIFFLIVVNCLLLQLKN